MTIVASGTVSMSDLRTEFVGGSAAISMSDLYRGGSNIRQKAANNTADNLADGIPTSGTIQFDDFYDTGKGFRFTFSAGATNQDISNLFGDDYGVDYPKYVVIDSGVELGATSTSQEALQADSGLVGSLEITNNGTLSGYGGSAGGGTGGDAFEANVTCTFINNGTLRAGGGGGGNGGTGGGGSYTSSSNSSDQWSWPNYGVVLQGSNQYWSFQWSGHRKGYGFGWYVPSTVSSGGKTYRRRGSIASGNWDDYGGSAWRIREESTSTVNTNGGAGGAGGRGQGYNLAKANGNGGSSGGTNAGTGGTGGSGGVFGQAGSNGSSGANGNRTNGSSGASGGASGKYLRGSSNVTFTNNGTVQGGTA
jgi:hypothetical protein